MRVFEVPTTDEINAPQFHVCTEYGIIGGSGGGGSAAGGSGPGAGDGEENETVSCLCRCELTVPDYVPFRAYRCIGCIDYGNGSLAGDVGGVHRHSPRAYPCSPHPLPPVI